MHERFGRRLDLSPIADVQLAEEHHAAALAIFHQRRVLEAEAALQDGQKIAAGRLLDQDRRDTCRRWCFARAG